MDARGKERLIALASLWSCNASTKAGTTNLSTIHLKILCSVLYHLVQRCLLCLPCGDHSAPQELARKLSHGMAGEVWLCFRTYLLLLPTTDSVFSLPQTSAAIIEGFRSFYGSLAGWQTRIRSNNVYMHRTRSPFDAGLNLGHGNGPTNPFPPPAVDDSTRSTTA